MQRNIDPCRPVGGFVGNFIRRLLDQEEPQQILFRRDVLDRQHFGIAGKEALHRTLHEGSQERIALRVGDMRLGGDTPALHHRGRVVERAEHAGDVAQPVVLCPAQCQRLRRFALEVDDVDIAVRHQHLPEMQIAVNARERRAGRRFGERADRRAEPVTFGRHDGEVLRGLRLPFPRHIERGQRGGKLLLGLLRPLRRDVGIRPLRRERRVIGCAHQHRVHLAEATAEQGGDRAVVLVLLGFGRLGLLGSRCQVRQAAHQQVQRPRPGIALVANETLCDRQRMAFAIGSTRTTSPSSGAMLAKPCSVR